MSQLRQLQFAAVILLLLAGYLWSHKLSDQYLQRSIAEINQSLTDQRPKVVARIEEKNDPLELINIGRKFLSAGNPTFAIIPLEKATELSPDFRDGWYLLGYSYLQAANEIIEPKKVSDKEELKEKAVAALKAAQKIDPAHEPTEILLRQLGLINS